MASAPPPPPVWPGDDKPAAPAWDPDADRPQPVKDTAGGVVTPSGSLEAGYVPPVRHAGMCDGVSCDCSWIGDCWDAVHGGSKWACRGYIGFLLCLTILLSIIIVLVGIYSPTYRGALAGVLVLSIVRSGAFTFCSDDFQDEAGVWCYMTASTFWIYIIVAFATCHTIVVVTAPNSLRNYHHLTVGTTFQGSIRDPAAFTGGYTFFNFTDAMFFPGSQYAVSDNTIPSPVNIGYYYRCAKYSYKGYCATPVVPLDYDFSEPITVYATCSTPCGSEDTCASLMRGPLNSRYDCFQQWAKTAYGDVIYGYKPLVYLDQYKGAKGQLGTTTSPNALYMRITSTEHVEDKKRRYKKYGILTEALVFGIGFGCSIIAFLCAIICCR